VLHVQVVQWPFAHSASTSLVSKVLLGNVLSVCFFYAPYCRCADAAGTGGLPSDVSPDEVHPSVLQSAKALHVHTYD
jgi:hypothetical protein